MAGVVVEAGVEAAEGESVEEQGGGGGHGNGGVATGNNDGASGGVAVGRSS